MCNVGGCGAKAVAKGLCAKHYKRQRRQGSPDKTGKAGRPSDPYLTMLRELFRGVGWSERTFARYARATRRLHPGVSESVIKVHTRPNGSINVSGMLQTVEYMGSPEFQAIVEIMDREGVTHDQAVMLFVEQHKGD